ncbi:hypothetical protein NQ318_009129 [Aromia moschata]|uniref:PHD-type domain-containing protein n=1 Tax=Aromia moschata TaxID=1265417 RepID=A0AAV8XL72_9CUCU|nr:hypothetical protein NQ318_009129 [Aromia moschata]
MLKMLKIISLEVWNLDVPNFYPRQPQLAHMSNEHSLLHQSTWHTPTTTEAMKIHPHAHMLSEMLKNDPLFPRDCVDLSLARNGNQNGELPTTPISLSVRDTNKINSLPASVLDIQAVELTKCTSPVLNPQAEAAKPQKRSNVRVDSILERLNPNADRSAGVQDNKVEQSVAEKPVSVIVQPASSFDENSNSSSIVNVPTSTNVREEDPGSAYSNEDSLDSNKSRRKRKPSKTVRVSKDEERAPEHAEPCKEEKDPISIVGQMLEENKIPERRRSTDELDAIIPAKTRRKASSESETIDNIAAMVQEGLKVKQMNSVAEKKPPEEKAEPAASAKPITVSVIKTKDNLAEALTDALSNSSAALVTPAQKKVTNPHFVEVENKLEEMFAGIEDSSDPLKTDTLDLDDAKLDDPLLKLDDPLPSTSQEPVTVTSTTETKAKAAPGPKKAKRRPSQPASRRNSDAGSPESAPKKKAAKKSGVKGNTKSKKAQKQPAAKADAVKDVYAYDSGSNASSTRSRGPFIQIRGPRDSPLSVSVVNTPVADEDGEKRPSKSKKFHDDSEYRHKVRSKGLHCSTLSNKYDAQTKDASWICAFCKRGPHASELTGPSSGGEVIPPGDLFGPYVIGTRCPEFERRLDDPYDRQFRSKKVARALDEPRAAGKKPKRKPSDAAEEPSDLYLGITATGAESYEIWAHEDCIVWSPGTYLVGPKIVGLEEAVWTSCNVSCRACRLRGANIFCLRRGCLNVAHLCCARAEDWHFLESDCKAYCPQHRLP